MRPGVTSSVPTKSSRGACSSRELGTTSTHGDHRDHDDRHVHQEDRPPPEVLEQEPADERADRHAEPRHAGPDADRPAPLARVGEDVRQDRQRGRHDERGAEALHPSQHDQRAGRADHRAAQRSAAEDHQADHEARLAAEPIAGVAADQQQAGEHDRVGVDDPLQLARRHVELAHQRRQGDVDDRAVDADDQQRQAQHAQHDPPARVGRACARDPDRGQGLGVDGHHRTSTPPRRRARGRHPCVMRTIRRRASAMPPDGRPLDGPHGRSSRARASAARALSSAPAANAAS